MATKKAVKTRRGAKRKTKDDILDTSPILVTQQSAVDTDTPQEVFNDIMILLDTLTPAKRTEIVNQVIKTMHQSKVAALEAAKADFDYFQSIAGGIITIPTDADSTEETTNTIVKSYE